MQGQFIASSVRGSQLACLQSTTTNWKSRLKISTITEYPNNFLHSLMPAIEVL
jgi:hypothetical protein